MTVNTDQVARDAAQAALAQIEKHEAVCTEIQRSSRATLERIESSVVRLERQLGASVTQFERRFTGIDRRFLAMAVAAIGVLLTIAGSLAAHWFK